MSPIVLESLLRTPYSEVLRYVQRPFVSLAARIPFGNLGISSASRLVPMPWRTDFAHHGKLRVYVIMKALSDKSIFFLVKRR